MGSVDRQARAQLDTPIRIRAIASKQPLLERIIEIVRNITVDSTFSRATARGSSDCGGVSWVDAI